MQNNTLLTPKIETVSQELVTEFTHIGLGIGFAIIDLAKRNFKDLKEIELNKSLPKINVFLATNKNITLTFASKKFMEYL